MCTKGCMRQPLAEGGTATLLIFDLGESACQHRLARRLCSDPSRRRVYRCALSAGHTLEHMPVLQVESADVQNYFQAQEPVFGSAIPFSACRRSQAFELPGLQGLSIWIHRPPATASSMYVVLTDCSTPVAVPEACVERSQVLQHARATDPSAIVPLPCGRDAWNDWVDQESASAEPLAVVRVRVLIEHPMRRAQRGQIACCRCPPRR